MIGNLEDYNYFVDQTGVWHDFSRLDENITHIVRKGVFIQDDENDVEEVVMSLCGLYHFTYYTITGKLNVDWYNSWVETEACEKCFGIINKREFHKWLVSDEGKEKLEESKE